MNIQLNSKFAEADTTITLPGGGSVLVTPPLDGDYWLMRVPLSDKQAIVCFPKFGTVGIGFQHEDDWNTNLPYTYPAQGIFDHIKHNKGDNAIADADCIAAIELLQGATRQIMAERAQ